MFRTNAWIIEPGRNAVRFRDLPVFILEEISLVSVKDAWRSAGKARGVILVEPVPRRFDAKHRVAIHSYWFDPDTARKVLDSPTTKITFTTRNATRDGAWRIEGDRPLTVDIFGAGETLPLDAATGVR